MTMVVAGFHYIDDLVAEKTNWRMHARVIRLWTQPDPKTKQELGSVEMILVDEKFARIQATISRQWLSRFFGVVREGETYLLENIMVGRNDTYMPKTTHKYKLNFMGATRVSPVSLEGIPPHVFNFLDFPNILETKKIDIFIDVIGHVVEKNNMLEKTVNGKKTDLLELVLEDLAQHRVKCALWGEFAANMLYVLQTANPAEPVVIVLQMCRLGRFQEEGNISTGWYGTKLYVNEDISAIHDYRSRLMVEDGIPLTQTVTQMSSTHSRSVVDELLNTARMTISDLMEATQPCRGSVLVEVVEFDFSEGWAFNSCNTCFRNAVKVGTGFTCKYCDTLVSATPRYKLNIVVIDDTGSTTVTLFNGLVALIVGRSATDLIAAYAKGGKVDVQPTEFEPMLGKKYLFKVEVTKGNIEKGYTTYTAKKFSCETDVIHRFINKHGINACSEEEEAVVTHALDKLASKCPVVDLGDSSNSDQTLDFFGQFDVTPSSKQLGKRPVADFQGIDLTNMDFSPDSVKKNGRGSIKIEPKE